MAGAWWAGFSARPAYAGGNMSLQRHISPASFPIPFFPARRLPIQCACSQATANVGARAITNVDAGDDYAAIVIILTDLTDTLEIEYAFKKMYNTKVATQDP